MFQLQRVFSQRNPNTGVMEWYFDAREGTMGPYPSEPTAQKALGDHIIFCIQNKLDGGRKLGIEKTDLTLEP
ncbi:MAG: hypothetical protein PHE55_00290 [Methylococcaceae bacterium]|nr:hypothetical protein [Methylococcaceae bacterium]